MSKVEPISTAVALRVLENKPAVVNFNYQEISDHLDLVLANYKGLVFTESTVAECKKTIAELRKGQKSLDEFRKATKKQLTESVTAFENQCKILYTRFDEVIQPLTAQQDQFELDRREKKREEIQSVIDSLIAANVLGQKYAVQLVILEDYFNKGKTIKAISAELAALANTLSIQEGKEAQDIDLIKTKVQLANAQYQISLMPDHYLRLLRFQSVAEIESVILGDAQQLRGQEDEKAEAPKVEVVMQQEPARAPEYSSTPVPVATPFGIKTVMTAVYEITGTEEQLSALESFLDVNNYSWIDRPND